jgi:general secretion pathway protein F
MPVYEFRGIQIGTGKSVKGFRDADNAKSLRGTLRKEGVLLTQASEESKKKEKDKRKLNLRALLQRPTTSDVAVMTRQLATLVRAGVPLVESVAALTDQVEKEQLVRVLTSLRENLNEGTSFAKSLAQHPSVFPPLYINMVAAGEASGTLEAVLERLADFMEGQARLKGKVSAALAYPILMVIIGSLLVGVLMVAVVPKVTKTVITVRGPETKATHAECPADGDWPAAISTLQADACRRPASTSSPHTTASPWPI